MDDEDQVNKIYDLLGYGLLFLKSSDDNKYN